MTYDQAERYFGGQGALRRAFHPAVAQSSVAEWKQRGNIPRGRQFELEVITAGKLTAAKKLKPPTLR